MDLLLTRALVRAVFAIAVMAWTTVVPAADTKQEIVSPALQKFVANTLLHHPEMRAARAELDRVRAEAEAADQPLYNPELGIEYEDADIREQTLGLRQTFDWADRREARSSAAAATLVGAEARFAAVREAFVAGLLTALANYEIATQLTGLAEHRVELMRRFASIADRRRKAGDLAQVDFNLAALARTEAEMQQARSRSREAAAEQQLRALTIGMADAWPPLPQGLPKLNLGADLSKLLATLPAILATHADAESAAAIVVLRRRERKPNPTFGVRAGEAGEENMIGLTFSIPLFVRNSYSAEVDVARADKRAATLNAAAIERDVRARLITAGRRYQNIRDAWHGWEMLGEATLGRQIDVLERLWQAGELGTTDYLVQLKQALDTSASALDLRNELWTAWFDWLEASARATDWVNLAAATPVGSTDKTRNRK